MSTITVVRHGSTEWSRQGRHTGRTDVALDDDGRRAARELAPLLATRDYALVLTSPLQRALATAALAGFGTAGVDDDLLEWDYGEYEGRTTVDIRSVRPGWLLWTDGCPGGEDAAAVGARVDRVIERARAAAGDVLLFAHGHVLRVLAARWIELPPTGGMRFALDPARPSLLGYEREVAVIQEWNRPRA